MVEKKLKQAESDKRNKLKQEKPYVYEKIMKFEEKAKKGESIAIIQFQYDYACNFKCPHCCVKRFQDQKEQGRAFTIEDVKELSRQADEMGLVNIVITGGEPLVFPDFDELVKAIDPKKFYIVSDSNGWLLDEEKARHLKEIGVDKVQISLDSISPENPDNFHNIKNANERALRAVDASLKAGLNVIVQTVVTKQRVRSQELIDFIKYMNDKDVGVFITYAKPVGAWEGKYDVLVDKDDMDYVRELEKKYNVFTHLTPSYGMDLGCIAVKRMISLTKYGDVMPCPYIHTSLGNFFEEPLKDIVERGLRIKQFGHHCDTCLIAEDRPFIKKYVEGKIYGKKIPVPYKEVFSEEDFMDENEKPDFYREHNPNNTDNKIKVSDYITKFLEKITDSLFLVAGGELMHIVDSARKSDLNVYCCHNEQGCATAADGYARIKNDIGVAAVTVGPGGTNAITGVAGSWTAGIPTMTLSGQVRIPIMLTEEDKKRGLRQIATQELNIIDIVKPITKYSVSVKDPNKIKYHLEKAVYLAKSGKPGPVWVEVPLDIQKAEINENELQGFIPEKELKYEIPYDKIINELNKAKKPVLLIGQGIRQANAINELEEFIEKNKINVVSAMSGTDLVTFDYPYYLGHQGMSGVESANYAIDNCDLLLVIGTRMQMRQTSWDYDKFCNNAIKIFVDIDKAEMKRTNFKSDIPVVADAKDFLQGLLKRQEEISLNRWELPREKIEYVENPNYIDIYQFLEAISEKDYPIITSNGMAADVGNQAIRIKKGERLITNSSFGQMGKALPMSVGACIALNKKPVICLAGDGSIMMNIQELQTMVHHKLPIKIFLLNNGGYYSIRKTMTKFFGKNFASDKESGVSIPDWSKLAPAWGIKYESIKTSQDLYKIDNILNSSEAVFCEVFIDPLQKTLPGWMATGLKDDTSNNI
tara:strand:- start:4423 stop:7206 length:2784 start_codon:yes stop_codon:yes gene_type:complete